MKTIISILIILVSVISVNAQTYPITKRFSEKNIIMLNKLQEKDYNYMDYNIMNIGCNENKNVILINYDHTKLYDHATFYDYYLQTKDKYDDFGYYG